MNRFVTANFMLCIGCHTCEATCSETHRQHSPQSMPRLRVMLSEKESTPQLCRHCEGIPCVTICPVNVITRADGAVQLSESLRVGCKLCGIACPFGATKLSGSRLLDTPTDANTPGAPPASPVPARVSTLLDWVPGIRAIAVKCDLCSFDERSPVCVWVHPAKALHLMDNTDVARANKRKRELTFNTDSGDLTLFQQAQSGGAK